MGRKGDGMSFPYSLLFRQDQTRRPSVADPLALPVSCTVGVEALHLA